MIRRTRGAREVLAIIFLTTGAFIAPSRVDATLIGVAYSDTNSPVWLIDEATGAGTLIGMAGFSGLNSLARDPSGTLFSAADTFRGDNTSLITIDPAIGGQGTLVATLDFGVSPDVRGLAFSPAGVLFALQNVAIGSPADLYTINVTTGIGTLAGSTGIPGLQGLDFAPDGTLFAWSTGQTGVGLVTLDPATGLGTDVNPSVDGSSVDVQSILFGTDGTLFGAGSSALSSIDPITGVTTLIGSGEYLSVRGIEECVGTCSTVPEPSTLLLLGSGLLIMSGAVAQRLHRRS